MSKLRVGFDLDGVLYDFGNSVRAYLDSIGREYGWKDDADEPHDWNFFEYWHMDRNEFKQVCDDGADAGYVFCGGTRPNSVESMRRVKELGHTVVIITDRFFGSTPDVSHNNTLNWLWHNGFQYDEIHFSPNKLIVPTDLFVEDKLENYDALVEAGVDAYLINRAWNQVTGGDARNRINDISEYADAIVETTKKGWVDLAIA